MKRLNVLLLLLVSSVTLALPINTFTYEAPLQYEDLTLIDPVDILQYTLYCSDIEGGPYDTSWGVGLDTVISQDVSECVLGTPGTYYFVVTAFSVLHDTESIFSNEVSKTYGFTELGKVPMPPTIISVQ